jgi:hypothetical protein
VTVRLARVLVCAFGIAGAGCSPPEITTPPERAVAYHGDWRGGDIVLSLTPSRAQYKNTGKWTSIIGDFKGLAGDDVVIKTRSTTVLKVSIPPHEHSGVWKMTLEGTELQRK